MKEYCLIPVKLAEKYKYSSDSMAIQPPTTSPRSRSKGQKKKTLTSRRSTSAPPMTTSQRSRDYDNPPMDELIQLSIPPAFREYGLSLVKLLQGKPGIAWDQRGNFLPPFHGLHIFDLIRFLGNAKGDSRRIPAEKKRLVSMLLRLAQLPDSAIVNPQQRMKLLGSGIHRSWEAY